MHRGERDREAGGGLRLPGERRRFDSFADLSLQIVPTGKPSPLTGCQIVNKTLTSLKVQCQEGKPGPKEEIFTFKRKILFQGFDGGLPANFLLELYHAEKMELKSQVTNKVPIFEVALKLSSILIIVVKIDCNICEGLPHRPWSANQAAVVCGEREGHQRPGRDR